MRAVPIIASWVLLAAFTNPATAAAAGTQGDRPLLTIQGEYRHDAGMESGDAWRERIALTPGNNLALFAAHRRGSAGGDDWTCSLRLTGTPAGFFMFAGHFALRWGAGLLAGRNTDPDLFSRRDRTRGPHASPFQAVTGGTASRCFQGLALGYQARGNDASLYVAALQSVRVRYLSAEEEDRNRVFSTLAALEERTRPSGRRRVPALLLDGGAVAGVRFFRYYTIQLLLLHTSLRETGGTHLRWDSPATPGPAPGTGGMTTCGISCEYRDGYLSLYGECGVPLLHRESAAGKKTVAPGAGVLLGMTLAHPFFQLETEGIWCSPNYTAPYSASARSPRQRWSCAIAMPRRGNLGCRASFSMMRRSRPGSGEKSIAWRRGETLSIRYRFYRGSMLSAQVDLSERGTDRGRERVYRCTTRWVARWGGMVWLQGRGIWRRGRKDAGLVSVECLARPVRTLTLRLGYARAFVAGGASFAMARQGPEGTESRITRSCNSISCALDLRLADIRLDAGYEARWRAGERPSHSLALRGRAVFF